MSAEETKRQRGGERREPWRCSFSTAKRRACDAADAVACNELGVLYQLAEGLVRDAEGAQRLYRQACEHGEPRAFRNLALLYESGRAGEAK